MFVRFLTVSFVFCLAAWARADKDGRDDLQGTWTIKRIVKDGKEVNDKEIGTKVVIKGDRIVGTDEANKEVYVVSYKVNPDRNPRTIDMKIVEGKDKGKTAEGIYSLEGNTLKFCYSYESGKRPTAFSTKAGDEHMLLELKREK